MRKLLLGTYTFLALVGVLFILIFIPNQTPEYMGYGLPSAFLPYCLAYCIIIFSCIELIKTFKNKADNRPSSLNKAKLIHLTKITGVAFLTFPLMNYISFIPGAILSLCAFQFLCGQRNYKLAISIAIVLSLFIYLIATYLLFIPLP